MTQMENFQEEIAEIPESSAEEEIRSRERDFSRLLDEFIELIVPGNISIDKIADRTLSMARDITGSTHGFVSSIDPQNGDNIIHTNTRMMEECGVPPDQKKSVFPRGPDGRYPDLWGWALNTGEPFFTEHPRQHPAAGGLPSGHIELQNLLNVPAVAQGEILGQIVLANKPGHYTVRDLDIVRRLASLYGMALLRFRFEERSRQEEIRYRELFDRIGSGAAVYEVRGEGEDFIFRDMNARGLDFSQLTKEEIIGHSVQEVFPGIHDIGLFRTFQEVWRTGEPRHHPMTTYRDDRIEIWVENYVFRLPSGEIVAVYDDVTERKRIEGELRRSEQNYRTIFETAGSLLIVLNGRGEIEECNGRLSEILGYQREEVLGRPLTSFMKMEKRMAFQNILELSAAKGDHLNLESSILRGDGQELEIILNLSELPGKRDGGLICIINDISGRKRAEEALKKYSESLESMVEGRTRALREAQESLVRKERLATLGQLTGTVAHELRNPLGTIRGALYTVSHRLKKEDPVIERNLERAERNILRCDRIIDELLDFTRTVSPDLEPVALDTWLGEELDHLEVPGVIHLVRELDSGATVWVDGDRIRRCLINLINNACEAITADESDKKGDITLTTGRIGDRIELRISDTGPGVAPDEMARIFEPLYSTKNFGVGLGLPTVQRIMELHGGGVYLENNPDRGTTAVLWFPNHPPRCQVDRI